MERQSGGGNELPIANQFGPEYNFVNLYHYYAHLGDKFRS
jgi:hypothetical protein